MFNSKFIFSLIIFITFLIITSFIKNQSRILEKQISRLNIKVLSIEKNLSETQLEFFYLTSPLEIEKKLINYDLKNLNQLNIQKYFTI